jgi:predicted phage replisome organizer
MADDVKWIKIATDIFDDEKITIIDAMPDADVMIVIWFKILALAGKINTRGVLIINEKIPYTDEMLANKFRRKLSQIKMALDIFSSLGMIEIINGVVTIPNWNKHQKLDLIENRREYQKEYMRERREKQKQLALGQPCKPNSETNSKPNVSVLDNMSSLSTSSPSLLSLDLNLKEETIEELFDDFWENYPRKVSKGQAETTFKKLKPNRELVDTMILKLHALVKNNWAKRDKDKIPHASTWLNAKGWLDEIEQSSQEKKMSALERFVNNE